MGRDWLKTGDLRAAGIETANGSGELLFVGGAASDGGRGVAS